MNDVSSDEILGDPEKAWCLATVGGMRIRLKADYKTNKSAFQGILEAALAPWGSKKSSIDDTDSKGRRISGMAFSSCMAKANP